MSVMYSSTWSATANPQIYITCQQYTSVMHSKLPCGFVPGEEAFLIGLLAVWWLILRCHDGIHGEAVVGGEGDGVEREVNTLTAAETITIVAPARGERGQRVTGEKGGEGRGRGKGGVQLGEGRCSDTTHPSER